MDQTQGVLDWRDPSSGKYDAMPSEVRLLLLGCGPGILNNTLAVIQKVWPNVNHSPKYFPPACTGRQKQYATTPPTILIFWVRLKVLFLVRDRSVSFTAVISVRTKPVFFFLFILVCRGRSRAETKPLNSHFFVSAIAPRTWCYVCTEVLSSTCVADNVSMDRFLCTVRGLHVSFVSFPPPSYLVMPCLAFPPDDYSVSCWTIESRAARRSMI